VKHKLPKLTNLTKLSKLHKSETLKHSRFSRANLVTFAIIFACVGGYLLYSSFAATQLNCFSSPGSCGYPDPAFNNVGVPAGTTLTPSGSINVTTAGTIIDAKDVSGTIEVSADNVTIKNTRVTGVGGGCGPTNTCGNSVIEVSGPYTVTISNVELTTDASTTVEHGIRNSFGGTINVDHVYQHANIDALCWCGNANISDTYSIIHLAISTDHLENMYIDGHTIDVQHNTLINTQPQTANIFANVGNGSGGACSNHLTVNNNLLAGGGWTIYGCGNATSQGTFTATITNNRFARCGGGSEVSGGGGTWLCPGGADPHGYFPRGGSFGVVSSVFSNMVWGGNYWDDSNQFFCDDRTPGCSAIGPSPPTVSISASPTTITSRASSILTWSSTNATSCSASGAWSGSKAISGSQSFSPVTTSIYTLSCIGSGGTNQASATVTVIQPGDITIGETNALSISDNGNANLLVAQSATLPVTATIKSLSFYVINAAGKLRLGIYDAGGPTGGPGAKKAETAEFTPTTGWNTAVVTTPVSLPAGTYWLAYFASDNSLAFAKATDASSSGKFYSLTYGALPITYSTSPTSTSTHWSLYATLNFGDGGSPSKPADINTDGSVNITDLSLLLSSYGQTTTNCDIKNDTPPSTVGHIDIFDLSLLLSGYGS
jgi:hypothetical protein